MIYNSIYCNKDPVINIIWNSIFTISSEYFFLEITLIIQIVLPVDDKHEICSLIIKNMLKTLIKKSLVFLVLGFLAQTNCFSKTKISKFKQEFQNPEKQYYSTPFWYNNGKMNDDEIVRQMTDAKESAKFNGAAILPVGSTNPDLNTIDYVVDYEDRWRSQPQNR